METARNRITAHMRNLHLKLAVRQLLKARSFTLLNILGLSFGLTTFLCITIFVKGELGYDRFNLNAGRIYRVNTDMKLTDHISQMADAAPPVAGILSNHYPEVQTAVRLLPQGGSRFQKGNALIREDRIVCADPDVFTVFTLPMIAGNPTTALQAPNTLVITETMANKYFGSTRVIGRTLRDVDDSILFTITGVIRDMPRQSSFHFDFFRTMRGTWMETRNNSLYALFPMSTFVLLKPGARISALRNKLATFMQTWDPHYDTKDTTFWVHLTLMPLTDIHLRSNRTDELEPNGSIGNVYIFSAIAAFVLLLAVINFMNLSTARSTNRAREVGVRKVLGSGKTALIGQFLSESFLTTLLATGLALILTALLLPLFNRIAGQTLALDGPTLRWLLPSVLLIVLIVGLLAGLYPAFVLSAFRPVDVLKAQPLRGVRASAFRNTLVVFQFAVSLFLIIGTFMVYRQLRYIADKDLGFSRDHILVIDGVSNLPDPELLKKEVLRFPEVHSASLSSFLPTNDHRWHNFGLLRGSAGNSIETQLWLVDPDYIPTLRMTMAVGRNFSPQFATDSTGIVINETAARAYGIADSPIGKVMAFAFFGGTGVFHVVGVVHDFNFASLRDNVTPLAMVIDNHYEKADNLILRIQSDHPAATIDRVKARWTSLSAHDAFSYSFMDADFDAMYHAEQRMGRISILFSILAVFIACLGLFGLAAYAAECRRKEIGIRKVMGAGVTRILSLLSRDFLRLIAISVVLAMPLAWLAVNAWLDHFAYRTTISLWLFAAAGLLVMIIALATTVFQSFRAAVTNPADVLRAE